ncbi:MAG: F0F1 ATP synthase subunit A, partial [Coriobacteriia bacterium]|nr:F0F1 ATP synthase subunit A [Coriobacteriia bacterium]
MNTVILAASTGVTDPFGELPKWIAKMLDKKVATLVQGGQMGVLEIGLSINTVGFVLTAILVGWLCYALAKKVTLVPQTRGVNAFEFLIDFVRNNIANNIHHDRRKYEPFLLTTFFFILISNFIGLLPNAKFATGTIGCTFALAMCVFVYFHYAGVRAKGGWGYVKGIVPNGVPGWLAPAIWLIEVVSMCLRP